ncbi:MAG: PIN domain-containing protein [Candidatus Omnitrophica bacterium]|nr:PIN domain-containing protein [Candidatus Omnitrophota bacterium]
MASVLDVNVLVALLHARHHHSGEAIQWLERQAAGSVLICRVAQMGALRLLTQVAMMKEDVLSAAEFWEGWEQIMADERFAFTDEPEGFERVWRELTRPLPKGRCVETDAYFAAFARSGGWTLVTFDRGFERFSRTRSLILH